MRPRTQKQPQVKKELCQVLDNVDIGLISDGIINYWEYNFTVLSGQTPT